MNELSAPMCFNCKHKIKGSLSCAAFPVKIPDGIISSEIDHRKPVKGDHGIQYDPVDPSWIFPDDLGEKIDDPSVVV